MKDRKHLIESIRQAKKAVDLANETLNSVMRELDEDELNAVSGAGDLFEDKSHVLTHLLSEDSDK